MTTAQKIIKYLAIAFAIALIVGIISSIASLFGMFYIFDRATDGGGEIGEMTEIFDEEFSSLEIEVGAASLTIETGEHFSVLCNNSAVTAKKKGETLEITEKSNAWIQSKNESALTVILPEGTVLQNFDLDVGAGRIVITHLTAETVEIDIGAAKLEAEYLCAKKRIDADLGAGDFTIRAGYLKSPDFDLGVGKTTITATVDGDGDFDCGVGEVDLTIYGSPADYTIRASRGIGDIRVDGRSVSDGDVIGNGSHTVRISGGVGSVSVSFLQD